MAWLYSHWRRSSSQSEGMTVQFCVSWFTGKAPEKKIARTAVTRRKAMQVRAKCTPPPYSLTVIMRLEALAQTSATPNKTQQHGTTPGRAGGGPDDENQLAAYI